MSEPFLAEIRIFTCIFAPKGWAFCNGQLLPINENQALFSLLGTNFGGDGRITFGLPNMQGAVPIHQGTGQSSYVLGQSGGSETVTVNIAQLPAHGHTFNVTTANATAAAIANTLVPAKPTASNASAYAVSQPNDPNFTLTALAAGAVANAGGSLPHNNVMPYLCLNFCIALQGIFPSQA
jgi:microcystin-dependent protein